MSSLNRSFAICLAIFGALPMVANSQNQSPESLKLVNEKGSQTIVNVQCGDGQHMTYGTSAVSETQGRPGKRGPPGSIGPIGEKGAKGQRGAKGEPGSDADLQIVRQEAGSMVVSNCEELLHFGITTTGYYLMRDPETFNAKYVYCDFTVRKDVFTCKQLEKVHHVTESGFYTFQSKNSTQTFQLYCNFGDIKVVTEIWHDAMREKKTKNCEAKGCYSVTPNYNIDLEHIIEVIKNSAECRQYIKFRCHGSVLVHTDPAAPFGWWTSRGGEKMLYWGGSTSMRNGYCACGEAGTCYSNKYKCNCDNNGNVMTQDEGYLTDKTKLPVKKMFFGDAGDASEHGWHTLGKLECMG